MKYQFLYFKTSSYFSNQNQRLEITISREVLISEQNKKSIDINPQLVDKVLAILQSVEFQQQLNQVDKQYFAKFEEFEQVQDKGQLKFNVPRLRLLYRDSKLVDISVLVNIHEYIIGKNQQLQEGKEGSQVFSMGAIVKILQDLHILQQLLSTQSHFSIIVQIALLYFKIKNQPRPKPQTKRCRRWNGLRQFIHFNHGGYRKF